MSGTNPDQQPPGDDMRARLDRLERENQRLRRKVETIFGPDNPCFDPVVFQRVLMRYMLVGQMAIYAIAVLVVALYLAGPLKTWASGMPGIGPLPFLSAGGAGTSHPGVGLGVIAVGGMAVGVVAMGGGAVGVIAVGGGALGILAIGGGAIGVVALGGGASGWIAIGGGAYGRYALGGRAFGKSGFGLNRQDPEAVEFFTRWLPRFRAAITTPMPVVPVDEEARRHD